jgi:hypothetical protein
MRLRESFMLVLAAFFCFFPISVFGDDCPLDLLQTERVKKLDRALTDESSALSSCAIVAHCTFVNKVITMEYGSAICLLVKSATITDCSCTKCWGWGGSSAGYGGAIWSDSASTRVDRVCGFDCSSSNYGNFLQFGGGENAGIITRFLNDSVIFRCGTSAQIGSGPASGKGSVADNKNPFAVTRVNFTACNGGEVSAISVTGAASLTALELVITACASAKVIEIAENGQPSSIGYTLYLDNTQTTGVIVSSAQSLKVFYCEFYGNSKPDIVSESYRSISVENCKFGAAGPSYSDFPFSGTLNLFAQTPPEGIGNNPSEPPSCIARPYFTPSKLFSLSAVRLPSVQFINQSSFWKRSDNLDSVVLKLSTLFRATIVFSLTSPITFSEAVNRSFVFPITSVLFQSVDFVFSSLCESWPAHTSGSFGRTMDYKESIISELTELVQSEVVIPSDSRVSEPFALTPDLDRSFSLDYSDSLKVSLRLDDSEPPNFSPFPSLTDARSETVVFHVSYTVGSTIGIHSTSVFDGSGRVGLFRWTAMMNSGLFSVTISFVSVIAAQGKSEDEKVSSDRSLWWIAIVVASILIAIAVAIGVTVSRRKINAAPPLETAEGEITATFTEVTVEELECENPMSDELEDKDDDFSPVSGDSIDESIL